MPNQRQLIDAVGEENLPHLLTAKKWDDLSEDEKSQWETIAKENQGMIRMVKLVVEDGCWLCRYKPESWDTFEFHAHSTHGISREMLGLMALKLGPYKAFNI